MPRTVDHFQVVRIQHLNRRLVAGFQPGTLDQLSVLPKERYSRAAGDSRPASVASVQHAFIAWSGNLVRYVDDHSRGDLPRAQGILQRPKSELPKAVPAEVFLPVHLRVLLQPLCIGALFSCDPVPDALLGVERFRHLRVRVGMDRERLYERLQPFAVGDQSREPLHC